MKFLHRSICILILIFLIILLFYFIIYTKRLFKKSDLFVVKTTKQIVFYNRIPKTGSTTFTNAIAYDLCVRNGFHVVHLNLTQYRNQMNKIDQVKFIRNVTSWTQKHPLFIHGHTTYIDFQSFGYQNPIWINILREPFERFISYYYFLQYGDNFRIGLKRSKSGSNETFDECFLRGAKECDANSIWLQIPYFCGTAYFCSKPGNHQALLRAKYNLLDHYLLVGTTERLEDMILLLEQLLPGFFRGAGQHFFALDIKRKHLRSTIRKIPITNEVERLFKSHRVYKMEREFYDFALAQFNSTFQSIMNSSQRHKGPTFFQERFHYEKIRGP